MFPMHEMFSPDDGYHVVDIHGKDETVVAIIKEAMAAKGYRVYGTSTHETKLQLNFVTEEFSEVLRERHHASCRNSAGFLWEGDEPRPVNWPEVVGHAHNAGSDTPPK